MFKILLTFAILSVVSCGYADNRISKSAILPPSTAIFSDDTIYNNIATDNIDKKDIITDNNINNNQAKEVKKGNRFSNSFTYIGTSMNCVTNQVNNLKNKVKKVVNLLYTAINKETYKTDGEHKLYEYNCESNNKSDAYNDFVLISNSKVENKEWYEITSNQQIPIPETIIVSNMKQRAIDKLTGLAKNYVVDNFANLSANLLQKYSITTIVDFVADISNNETIRKFNNCLQQGDKQEIKDHIKNMLI